MNRDSVSKHVLKVDDFAKTCQQKIHERTLHDFIKI